MQKRIPAVFMRGGTSKGLFFKEADLPSDFAERNRLFLDALGSPDPFGRQLNGMGGGISSLSKIVIVNATEKEDADVEYTFAQVSVDQPIVDYGANCGNLSSAVGPFAVDEGLVRVADGDVLVRLFNTNSQKYIHSRFPVSRGSAITSGDYKIPGVAGTGAKIRMDYIDPAGALTGRLLPTSRTIDEIELDPSHTVEASLLDATIPVVFVRASDVGLKGTELPKAIEQDKQLMSVLDQVRRCGGVLMGLGKHPDRIGLAAPKVALVAANRSFQTLDGRSVQADEFDIAVRVISMERVHLAVPLTVAMCLSAAMMVEGTLANVLGNTPKRPIRIGNPSGILLVDASVEKKNEDWEVTRTTVYRTARRLMEGKVLVPEKPWRKDKI